LSFAALRKKPLSRRIKECYMIKVFVSYSRKDTEFAKQLTGELKKNKLEFWVDWEGIPPTVDFMKKIEKGIEESDAFLFLISPDSVTSEYCGREIDHAVKSGKRIITLMVRDIKPEKMLQALSHINWISFRKQDNFAESFQKLLLGINTDFEWVDVHSRLLVRALEWRDGKKDYSLLLRGKDLLDAEFQLATNTSKNPHPTDLHREYILTSRQVADGQRRWITLLAVIIAIVMFALGVYGLREAKRANVSEQGEIIAKNHAQAKELESKINQLSALAVTKIDQNFNEALVLGVEAYLHAKDNQVNNFTAQGAITKILQSNPGLIHVLLGHTDWVNTIATHPNSNILASGGWDNTVILWDISDPSLPEIIKTLSEHTSSVESVAFSSDGKTLASSSFDSLILWDISDPSDPKLLGKIDGDYSDLLFTHNDTILSSIKYDENITGSAVLFNVSNKKSPVEVSRFDSGDKTVGMTNLAINPAKNLLFSSLENGNILEWDITDPNNPALLFTIEGNGEQLQGIAISADGRTLAIGKSDTAIALWDITDPAAPFLLSIWGGHSLPITSLAFSADGATLASSSDETNASIVLWDISNRNVPKKIRTLNGHSLTVTSMIFNQNNGMLTSGSHDGTIMLWDVINPKTSIEAGSIDDISNHFTFNYFTFNGFAFQPNGSLLASGSADGTLAIWDISNPGIPKRIKDLKESYYGIVAFSPDGKLLASSDGGKNVVLRDASEFANIKTIKANENSTDLIAFSADGKTLATVGDQFVLWDVTDPKKPISIADLTEQNDGIRNLVFSSDGKFMASTVDKTVVLWDVSNPAKPAKLSVMAGHSNSILAIAFNPTNTNLFASAGADKTIILWELTDPRSPQNINILSNHSDWVNTISFSPDGTLLASGSDDKQVNVWNISNPEAPTLISKMIGHTDVVNTVAFNPLGDLLASLGDDRKIIFWDINPESWIQDACSISGRDFTIIEWNQFFPSEEYRQTCEPFRRSQGIAQAGEPPPDVAVPTAEQSSVPLPVCTSDQTPSCSLPASKKLDEFCVDNNVYGLYNLPLNTTYEVLTPGFTCINEKDNSAGARISCTGPIDKEFEVSFCNSTCANTLETSYQCEAGFGLNSAQGCCAPISSTSNGCVTEKLTLLGCK